MNYLLTIAIILTNLILQSQISFFNETKIALNIDACKEVESSVKEVLKDKKRIFFSEENAEYLIKEIEDSNSNKIIKILVGNSQERTFTNYEYIEVNSPEFNNILTSFYEKALRIDNLKNLYASSKKIDFSILIHSNEINKSNLDSIELDKGSNIHVTIKNTGDIPFFISWAIIYPNNLTYSESNPNLLFLKIGQSIDLTSMNLDENGTFYYKFIASKDFMSLDSKSKFEDKFIVLDEKNINKEMMMETKSLFVKVYEVF